MSDAGWQNLTLRRLFSLGYDGFSFGPGTRWWVRHEGEKVAGPFHSTLEFDEWLERREAERFIKRLLSDGRPGD